MAAPQRPASKLEVADQKSFSKAARRLHVTPSAVSHRIRELEELLGVELFVRTTRSVRPTASARELVAGVQAGLSLIHESVAQIQDQTSAQSLTVSCSPSFAIRWLLPRLERFRTLYPELEVHVAADDNIADPRRDDIDVCIRYGAGDYPGLEVVRLRTEWVFPVCSAEFQRRHRISTVQQLSKLPLLHHDVMKDHPKRVDWARWCRKAGLDTKRAQRGIHFSHAHMALLAALAGEGVALGRSSLVEDDLCARRLVRPIGPRVRSGLAYFLVTHGRPSGDSAAFRDWLLLEMRGNKRLAMACAR